ncbi:MAG: hypothetical protein IT293_05545 [Deltaproteobacteria bacterium]|nr:hypothetical protein [Deltaproteobacteria bacterium]
MRIGRRALSAAGLVLLAASAVRAADPDAPAAAASPAPPAASAPGILVAGSRAGDYVGRQVTVEGRVAAIHESPLATVVAFSPNFAGFTATILAGDRDKFPRDLEARIRDHVVRVSGTVTAYRGKPEMALHDPSQLVLAPPPAPGSVAARPAAPTATPDGTVEELRRALTRVESRLDAIESRLGTLEEAGAGDDGGEPAPGR